MRCLSRSSVDGIALQGNVEVVAEAIAQYLYNFSMGHWFQGRLFSGETVR